MKKSERAVLEKDRSMKELVRNHRAPRLGGSDPYVAILQSVVGQQLSGHAAEAIWQRMEQAVGTDPNRLRRCRITTLRKAGLSGAKANTVKLVAAAKLRGELDDLEGESDEVVAGRLTALKGIGPWTADMVMMFALGRKDVWPVGDGGVQRAAARLYGAVGRDEVELLGERFRPVRSYAAWYLWRSLEV